MDKRRLGGKLTLRNTGKPAPFRSTITPEQLAEQRRRVAEVCNASVTLQREFARLRAQSASGRLGSAAQLAAAPPAPAGQETAAVASAIPELPAREMTAYLITLTAALNRCAAGDVAAGHEILRQAARAAAAGNNPCAAALAARYQQALECYAAQWGEGEPAAPQTAIAAAR